MPCYGSPKVMIILVINRWRRLLGLNSGSWGARSSFKKETTDLLVRGLQSGKIGVERLTQFPIAVECRAGWAVFAPDHEGVQAGEF